VAPKGYTVIYTAQQYAKKFEILMFKLSAIVHVDEKLGPAAINI
jgi:hypothetical protein